MNTNYPTQWEKVEENPSVDRRLRSVDKGVLKTFGKSKLSDSTFVNDAARIWNAIPESIKNVNQSIQLKMKSTNL